MKHNKLAGQFVSFVFGGAAMYGVVNAESAWLVGVNASLALMCLYGAVNGRIPDKAGNVIANVTRFLRGGLGNIERPRVFAGSLRRALVPHFPSHDQHELVGSGPEDLQQLARSLDDSPAVDATDEVVSEW